MFIQHLSNVTQGSILAYTPSQGAQKCLQWAENLWQQILIIPTWPMKYGHIPPPGVVSYSILCLFILKDGQIDLHPKAPYRTHWYVTAAGCSHHFWVCKASITSSIRTCTPWRWWASGRTSRNPWCSLLLVSSTMSNCALSAGITGSSHLPIGHSLVQASHPIIYVTGASQGPDGSPQPPGVPWAPGLCFLLRDSICNSSMAVMFCHTLYDNKCLMYLFMLVYS